MIITAKDLINKGFPALTCARFRHSFPLGFNFNQSAYWTTNRDADTLRKIEGLFGLGIERLHCKGQTFDIDGRYERTENKVTLKDDDGVTEYFFVCGKLILITFEGYGTKVQINCDVQANFRTMSNDCGVYQLFFAGSRPTMLFDNGIVTHFVYNNCELTTVCENKTYIHKPFELETKNA